MSTAHGTTALPARRLTTARVLRSEWHKLWTLRSSWITLLTASVLTLGIGLFMGGTYESDGSDSDVDVVVIVLIGMQFSQVALAVLGILCTAGEYANGMVRASLTAVPRRLPVLWSKAAVFGSVVLVLTTATHLVTFLGAQAFLHDTDQAASLGDPGVLRAVLGSAAGLTLLGLTALGLGALLRSVPGAIGAFVVAVLALPEVIGLLPYEAVRDAVAYFPAQCLRALGSAHPVPDAASPATALLALALWAAGTLALAGTLLKRRDV
ncbi:ABC transporter permease [Streptomyces sp. NPDC001941]|uniref:ABC transporter permease n=1 Tax=Streptomyces sp. NPDC001941 TaxID=3154659 RepID=UPI0033243150